MQFMLFLFQLIEGRHSPRVSSFPQLTRGKSSPKLLWVFWIEGVVWRWYGFIGQCPESTISADSDRPQVLLPKCAAVISGQTADAFCLDQGFWEAVVQFFS